MHFDAELNLKSFILIKMSLGGYCAHTAVFALKAFDIKK